MYQSYTVLCPTIRWAVAYLLSLRLLRNTSISTLARLRPTRTPRAHAGPLRRSSVYRHDINPPICRVILPQPLHPRSSNHGSSPYLCARPLCQVLLASALITLQVLVTRLATTTLVPSLRAPSPLTSIQPNFPPLATMNYLPLRSTRRPARHLPHVHL